MNSCSKKQKLHRTLTCEDTQFRIEGQSRKYGEGVLLFTKQKNGWSQTTEQGSKSFHDCLNVRYVCDEDLSELEEWIRIDFIRFNISKTRFL